MEHVMIKSLNKLIEKINSGGMPLWFDAFVVDGDKGWVFANDFNGLFELDLCNYDVTYLGSVPDESIVLGSICFSMVKIKNELVLIPFSGRDLNIYNMETKEFRSISHEHPEYTFFGAVACGHKVYMIGNNAPIIAVLDLKDNRIKYLDEIESHKRCRKRIADRMSFRKGICLAGEYVYCVSCDDNEIYQIKVEDDSIEYFEIPDVDNGLRNIAFDGNDFWISEWEKASLIKWNENGTHERYVCEFYNGVAYRSADVICGEDIWLFPNGGDDKDDVVVFDKNRKEWRIVEQLKKYGSDSEVKRNPWNQIFPVSVSDGTSIYSYAANTNELVKIFSYSVKESKVLKVQIESNVISDWVRPLLCERVLDEADMTIQEYFELIDRI